jgi:histidinol-phosphate aminotransferase
VDFEKLAREDVLAVNPYIPGKPVSELQRERGLAEVVKLASNENPEGPGPSVLAAVAKAAKELNRYPDDSAFHLYRALAENLGLAQDRLFLANGSVEILYQLANVFVKPGENVVFASPSFVIYKIAGQISLGECRSVPTDADFKHDLPAMAAAVDEKTKIVFIANPNNPTGTYNTSDELELFMETVPSDVLVAVDEAYYEFVQATDYAQTVPWLDRFPNLIVLRTFSKIYSLAGLRIGYSISHPDVVGLLQRVRPPFNVNSLSQVAAMAVLQEEGRVERIRRENSAGRRFVTDALRKMGCRVLDSQTNFVLAFLPLDAAEANEALLSKGVIIRPMGSFGTDMNAVRISIGLESENRLLVDSIGVLMAGRDGA